MAALDTAQGNAKAPPGPARRDGRWARQSHTLFRIHGTNEPDTIGQAVSSGCIRMMNADVIDLYERVGDRKPESSFCKPGWPLT
jgi:lipoprotein-anchoring transpeptidase ErfK/SrfK